MMMISVICILGFGMWEQVANIWRTRLLCLSSLLVLRVACLARAG